jgi:hypothetical protein
LKCLFSQVQGDFDLQEIFKPIPLLKKATRKKAIVIMMIEKNEKSERIGKIWMDGKILHLISGGSGKLRTGQGSAGSLFLASPMPLL